MKSLRTQNFTAYIGLDWADTKHDICLQEAGSERREFACIAHQVECIDEWGKSLQQRFGGSIAIALELAKGPIVYALQKYDFLVLFPINPLTLAKYREAFRPSRAKDDTSPNCATNFPRPTGDWSRRGLPCPPSLLPRRIPRRVLPPVVLRRNPMWGAATMPHALSPNSAPPRAPSRPLLAQRVGFPIVRSGIFAAVTLQGSQ